MIDIIEYNSKYDEEVKDLLVELQEYIAMIDKEKYNILTPKYREESFKDNLEEIEEKQGKMFLASINNEIVGFIIGIIIPAENSYEFKAPKGGKITELIVSKKCRAKGIGQALLNKMEEYFKNLDCKRILIEVFEYNEAAKSFYDKNKYFNRCRDIMKKID